MRTWSRALLVLALALVVGTFFPVPGFAQTSNGDIAGAVIDATGAVLVKATVSATSLDMGGDPHVTTTDTSGTYRIGSLLPGRYSVLITLGGFTDFKINDLIVKASLTTTANATLEVGQAKGTTITVEASAGQELQTQSGDLSANISSEEIHNLPINNLNPISLVLTEPGVQTDNGHGFSNGQDFSVNGTRPRANNFLIDGQDNNDNAINGQAFQATNLEALSQVTILTNSYSAEFGRGGGSVTNVIYKGGTNDFHGSVFELATNSDLASVPHENKFVGLNTNPVSVENTFGFAFGGPIKHDKLFVFGSSQWDRTRSTANGSTLTAPTANGVAELQALGANPNAQLLIASFAGLVGTTSPRQVALGSATPSGPDRGNIEFGLVQRAGIGEIQNDRQYDIRVDFVASQRDTLNARYYRDDGSFSPDLFNFPRSLVPFDSQQGGPSQSVAAGWTHTVSSQAVNELRASYTSISFGFIPTAATAANPLFNTPLITIAGIGTSAGAFPSLGFPGNLPQSRAHKSYQYQDALSITAGRHTFKVGVDVNHLSVVDGIPFNSRGSISFAKSTDAGTCGAKACTGLANFIDNFTGPSGAINKSFGNPILQPFVTTFAPYVQDTWRLRENFTLNLGLRYEYSGTPENVLLFPAIDTSVGIGLLGTTFPSVYAKPQIPDRNNFAPRVGFAYTPHFGSRLFGHDKTVIRAGYGIFYDGLFTNILDNTGGSSPNAVGGTIVGGAGRGSANATGLLNAVAPVLNPRGGVNTIASNLQNPLTHQWNLDIQRELPGGFVFTAAYVGTRGERLFINQQFNPRINFGARVNPAYGPITVRDNGGDSIYHSGQFSVDRKFSRGFLFRAAYTYSKLIDNGSEVFVSTGLSSFAQDPFNQRADRGLSAYDRRQRFVATAVWELPYVHRNDNLAFSVLKALTSKWQLTSIVTFQSGRPDTIVTGADTLGDGSSANDRPNVVAPNLAPGDFNRYAPAANGSVGNLGRNTYIGPNENFWDSSITRIIPLSFRRLEHQSLTFRAEFFNTLNHTNQDLPGLNLANGASAAPGDGGFGDLVSTVHGQRQIKIYLKYSF